MSFVTPTPEEAAAWLGFDMGHAYAIRAIPPQGKTQEALERQMADDELIVGFPHLRGLFRQHWRRGYHRWHVYQLAREWFERTSPAGMDIIHVRVQQQGGDEYAPWACEGLRMHPLSGESLPCLATVRWITEAGGIPVNWWMVFPGGSGNRSATSDDKDK